MAFAYQEDKKCCKFQEVPSKTVRTSYDEVHRNKNIPWFHHLPSQLWHTIVSPAIFIVSRNTLFPSHDVQHCVGENVTVCYFYLSTIYPTTIHSPRSAASTNLLYLAFSTTRFSFTIIWKQLICVNSLKNKLNSM